MENLRDKKSEDLIFKKESYAIIGACFEVYRQKGNGFLEAVYQEYKRASFSGD